MRQTEIEIKFLDIDPAVIEKKLLKLGAKKEFDEVLEEWIFQKPEWQKVRGRARIRVGKGKTSVSYKETTKKSSEGNVEIEFAADNKDHALAFINKLEIPLLRHQQKRRIHFVLDDVTIDIDFWPQIPPFIELEGDDVKTLERVAKQLGLSLKDACELDALQVIQDIYHVEVDSLTEYVFA